MTTAGTLYLVATPIGNLGDITLRALETLRAVSVVLAEDTRRTRALLTHFEIKKPLVNHDAHASPASIGAVLERLLGGESAALVTDAGTPSVSDPGTALVAAAYERGVPVVPIPGVSAVTAAVAASGLVDSAFSFFGFPARGGKKRADFLNRVARSREPVVLFESPHRVGRLLEDLAELAPQRRAVMCRELTKLHEEIARGTLAELAARDPTERGEVTLVIDGSEAEDESGDEPPSDEELLELLSSGESPRAIVDALGTRSGGARRELYRRVTELARSRES
jgi:16S rRNA (cytidine1402-2'-O)-methyltransferase